jgi:hypothetical protein
MDLLPLATTKKGKKSEIGVYVVHNGRHDFMSGISNFWIEMKVG